MEKIIDEKKQGETLSIINKKENTRKVFIESYGCQMNFSDSEVVASILEKEGYSTTKNSSDADLILLNTCSIREKAEQTVKKRITDFRKNKQKNSNVIIGVLGCMAERLKSKFIEEEIRKYLFLLLIEEF